MSAEPKGKLHAAFFELGGAGIFDEDKAAVFCDGFDLAPENARRMVACWNACIGIDTASLEQSGVSALISAASRQVIEDNLRYVGERDQLLEALEAIVNEYAGISDKWMANAKAAIAAVKGGAA